MKKILVLARAFEHEKKHRRETTERVFWSSWTYDDIYNAYDRPSVNKVQAWEYCKELCAELDGWDICITSKNTMCFSVCFRFEIIGHYLIAYITKDYNRYILYTGNGDTWENFIQDVAIEYSHNMDAVRNVLGLHAMQWMLSCYVKRNKELKEEFEENGLL